MNDDLHLDNLEDELQDDQELDESELEDQDYDDEEEGEDEPPEPRRGDLSKALQAERREKRELKEKLAQMEADQRRANALLERMGQGQPQHRQVDEEQRRAQLQTWMLERPDEFMGSWEQRIRSSMNQQFAPLLAAHAERIITANPQHKAAYENPEIRTIVDQFVQNEIHNGGIQDIKDLQDVLGNVMSAVLVIQGSNGMANQSDQNPNRKKMTSIAQKGASAGRKAPDARVKELQNLARTNPRKYVEEMKKPENKALVNEVVFGRKRSPT